MTFLYHRYFLNIVSTALFFISLTFLVMFYTQSSQASEGSSADYAVVNVERVMKTSMAAQSIEKQLKAKNAEYSKEFSAKERELREALSKLIQDNEKLKEDQDAKKIEAFEQKRREFEKKRLEAQELFQKRRGTLNNAVNLASAKIQKEMFETVAGIADKQGYRIVFDRKSVVIVEETLDITEEVLGVLNKSIPNIKLDIKE